MKYYCSNGTNCPDNFEKIEDKKKCVQTEKEILSDESLTNETEYDGQELVNSYNKSQIDSGKDTVEQKGNKQFTMTSTENQEKGQKTKNTTNIILGECETKLKEKYDIPEDKSLYILMVDISIAGSNKKKVEYEVYYSFDGSKLTKLDLDTCKDVHIEVNVPVYIDQSEMDIFNKSSGYYNDICYPTSSDNGTDMSLSDRKKEYIEKDRGLCEKNCELIGYDEESEKAKCSCQVKMTLNLKEIIDKEKLEESFNLTKVFLNLPVLTCLENVFDLENLSSNYGFYPFLPIVYYIFFPNYIGLFH